MFAMIFVSGMAIVRRGPDFDQRDMVIVAVALGLAQLSH